MAIKRIVRCADYNGHKNVLFMMDADDFRLSDERFASNYTNLGEGAYSRKERTLTAAGYSYEVFEDWSLKLKATA